MADSKWHMADSGWEVEFMDHGHVPDSVCYYFDFLRKG